jgi:4-hydroxyphenylpyruvate dioxygenase
VTATAESGTPSTRSSSSSSSPSSSTGPSTPDNPSGLDGIEFIEYATARPLALGHVLEVMGFQPVARHRSREVLLYRQGAMNVVINAHEAGAAGAGAERPGGVRISAVALRAHDAAAAYRHALDRGAWAVPTRVEVMELNIPAIHGVGATRIYFVDRYREFSIYTVDFVPIPHVDQQPPAIADLHWFGLVQRVGSGRLDDWTEFYRELFAFAPVPAGQRFGILPGGRILRSPCHSFYVQLLEPEPEPVPDAGEGPDERLVRIGLGAPDVAAAARALAGRGVAFVAADRERPLERGALTRGLGSGVAFELVCDPLAPASAP